MSRSTVRDAPSGGGVDIAYQVVGDGPVDPVFVSGFITHLEEQLDGVARVITFRQAGHGPVRSDPRLRQHR
jgi:hypothetical protein